MNIPHFLSGCSLHFEVTVFHDNFNCILNRQVMIFQLLISNLCICLNVLKSCLPFNYEAETSEEP